MIRDISRQDRPSEKESSSYGTNSLPSNNQVNETKETAEKNISREPGVHKSINLF